jgi:hypothetical protein
VCVCVRVLCQFSWRFKFAPLLPPHRRSSTTVNPFSPRCQWPFSHVSLTLRPPFALSNFFLPHAHDWVFVYTMSLLILRCLEAHNILTTSRVLLTASYVCDAFALQTGCILSPRHVHHL